MHFWRVAQAPPREASLSGLEIKLGFKSDSLVPFIS